MATDEIAHQRCLAPEATLGVTTDGGDAATTAGVNCSEKQKNKRCKSSSSSSHEANTAAEILDDIFPKWGRWGGAPVGKWIRKAVRLQQTRDRCKRGQFHGCHQSPAKKTTCRHFMNKGEEMICENDMEQGSTGCMWRVIGLNRCLEWDKKK